MSELETVSQYNTNAPIVLHFVAVAFFVTTGTIFNGIILYIQKRKTNRSEMDIYIITLACVDLCACLVICPQYPFLGVYQELYRQGKSFAIRQFFTCASFMMRMCLGLLTAIALTRVNAIFRPLTFVWFTKRSKWIAFALFLFSLIGSFLSINAQSYVQYGDALSVGLAAIQIPMCLILVSGSYLAIFVRLQQQNTTFDKYRATGDATKEKGHGNRTSSTSESNQQKVETPAENPDPTSVFTVADNLTTCNPDTGKEQISDIRRSPRSRSVQTPAHMKTLKMFFFVTVIFVVSYIPLVCEMTKVTNMFCITYITLLNNNTNLVVYIVFNTDFRQDVTCIWKRFKSCFRTE